MKSSRWQEIFVDDKGVMHCTSLEIVLAKIYIIFIKLKIYIYNFYKMKNTLKKTKKDKGKHYYTEGIGWPEPNPTFHHCEVFFNIHARKKNLI